MIDWDVVKLAAIINLTLGGLWKLREMTIAQIMGTVNTNLAQLEMRLMEKFVLKEELREEIRLIQEELHHH